MKPTEIKKIIKIAQSMGLKSIKFDGIEAEFFDERQQAAASPAPGTSLPRFPETEEDLTLHDPMPSDEQMLEWSSPTYSRFEMPKVEAAPEVTK